jgi:hypothetical protein
VSCDTWILSRRPVLSILEAVFIVSPKVGTETSHLVRLQSLGHCGTEAHRQVGSIRPQHLKLSC